MITDLISAGLQILDKVLPDPVAKAEAKAKLLLLQQQGELRELELELQRDLAQSATNTAEAGSQDPFVRRWRPAIGWICGIGLGYQFLLQPLLAWLSSAVALSAPPAIELGDLLTLLVGMLGLSGMRTAEKIKGVAS